MNSVTGWACALLGIVIHANLAILEGSELAKASDALARSAENRLVVTHTNLPVGLVLSNEASEELSGIDRDWAHYRMWSDGLLVDSRIFVYQGDLVFKHEQREDLFIVRDIRLDLNLGGDRSSR